MAHFFLAFPIMAYDMPPHWESFQPPLTYQTHVDVKGWSNDWKQENLISDDINQQHDLQAIKINLPGHKVYQTRRKTPNFSYGVLRRKEKSCNT